MTAPVKRYPGGPVTPHGAYMILKDRVPMVDLTAHDGSIRFDLLGGLSVADRFQYPERVEIIDMSGLIAPWKLIDQKGATQHGVTNITHLYDPTEVKLKLRIRGRTPAHARQVYSDLIASLDAGKTSPLAFFTHRLGYWWTDLRFFQAPDDPATITKRTQEVNLRLRADNAFWTTWPSTDSFVFQYSGATDDFTGDDVDDLGTGWTTAYSGSGSGIVRRLGGQAVSTLTGGRRHVSRKAAFTTTSNNQVIEFTIGSLGQWFFPTNSYMDIWGRMNNTGTPGTSGIRLRLMRHKIQLHYFSGGTGTLLREKVIIFPPRNTDKWRLVLGDDSSERSFTLMRGPLNVLSVKEIGTATPLGASNRSVGFGAEATSNQPVPAITEFRAGDNAEVDQSTFLERYNPGDQGQFDDYICHGPGLFKFWNGPNAGPDEYVEFGPILENQIMYVRTHPEKRGVKDMTVVPPTPQAEVQYKSFLQQILDFATGNNVSPLAEEYTSVFGVKSPQGNPYRLLNGRWNDGAAIPPKSPGKPLKPYYVKVAVEGGNANTKVIVTGAPLRRNPY